MKRQIIDVPCEHCSARPSKPCRSVGDRVIVDPHMRRIERALGKGWGEGANENTALHARAAYTEAAIVFVFGRCSPDLLRLAKKDRAIDVRKKWVRDALAGPLPTFHAEKIRPRYLTSPRPVHGVASSVQLELL